MIVVPIFHSEYPDRNVPITIDERHLKTRNESSKQRDEDHHASNHSTITLDEHKHPRSNLYYKLINGIAVPGGMLRQELKVYGLFLI